jgi:hypothetical protein
MKCLSILDSIIVSMFQGRPFHDRALVPHRLQRQNAVFLKKKTNAQLKLHMDFSIILCDEENLISR